MTCCNRLVLCAPVRIPLIQSNIIVHIMDPSPSSLDAFCCARNHTALQFINNFDPITKLSLVHEEELLISDVPYCALDGGESLTFAQQGNSTSFHRDVCVNLSSPSQCVPRSFTLMIIFFGLDEALIFGGCSWIITSIVNSIISSSMSNFISITINTRNNGRFKTFSITNFIIRNFRNRNFSIRNFIIRKFSTRNFWPGGVFNITVSIIPSGVLLNVGYLIISHSFKNMFNNKLIVLRGFNSISKKWNFRVRNHRNKNLVNRQGVVKIISRPK